MTLIHNYYFDDSFSCMHATQLLLFGWFMQSEIVTCSKTKHHLLKRGKNVSLLTHKRNTFFNPVATCGESKLEESGCDVFSQEVAVPLIFFGKFDNLRT